MSLKVGEKRMNFEEYLKNFQVFRDEKENLIYFSKNLKSLDELKVNSFITFKGEKNIAFFDEGALLKDVNLVLGQNCLFFLGKSVLQRAYVEAFLNSTCYIGNKNYFNPAGGKSIIISERTHFIMGDDCLMSLNIWFRTADPHLIYDALTHTRINPSKSIFIGDHCWIAQDCGFVKGAILSSGTIIGAKSLVTSKTYFSNTINAGNPCKELKKGVFFTNGCVHTWDDATSEKFEFFPNKNFVFSYNEKEFLKPELIDKSLSKLQTSDAKLAFVLTKLHLNKSKNRFACFANRQNLAYDDFQSDFTNAFFRIKTSLEYKLGFAMIQGFKSFFGLIKLPFVLLLIVKKHKKEKEIYNTLIKFCPELKLLPLEKCKNFHQALRLKEHLSYQLGFVFLKAFRSRQGGGDCLLSFIE
ncbi:TPA: hypothetical protein RTG31_001085 [Campylobacter jejuni]|nr:hypothetical protein [Campylobacter jejuni]HDZ5014321.1 hypothetical protein [Campylobacter jejuni]HDZ5025944.1 hypothetical protein [Campylobacter jejuni]